MRAVQQIIEHLSQQKGFSSVVLTDATGLTLATSADRAMADELAAVVAEMLRASESSNQRLNLGIMGEIMLLADDAQQGLLCRRFNDGARDYVLAVVIRPNNAYWQATATAIQQIKDVMREKRA